MKILLIVGTLPWPLESSGGSQRNGHLVRALEKWGEVDVLLAAERTYLDRPETRQQLGRANRFNIDQVELNFSERAEPWGRLSGLAPGKLGALLDELGRDKAGFTCNAARLEELENRVREGGYNLVVTRHLRLAAMTGAAFLAHVPTLLDFDDIDWAMFWSREAVGPQGIVRKIRTLIVGWHLEHVARQCLSKFGHVWVASEDGKAEVSTLCTTILPNIPILPVDGGSASFEEEPERDGILFVGELGYWANASGLERFLKNVWPGIVEVAPDATLRVVGRIPEDSPYLSGWGGIPNVEFLGFVENLDEVYKRCKFSIAPVYWGGGTKIKVLESLGRERTLVCAPHATSGVGDLIRDRESVWCAGSDKSFVEGCITLLEDPVLRRRMELRGSEIVRQNFSMLKFQERVDTVLGKYSGNHCPDTG